MIFKKKNGLEPKGATYYNLFNLNKFISDIKKKVRVLDILLEIKEQHLYYLIKNSKNKNSENKNFLIAYIIEIAYTKINAFLYVKNPDGKLLIFCSAGSVFKKTTTRNKKNKKKILDAFFDVLEQKNIVLGRPIAMHLKNTGRQTSKIIEKFKDVFYIKVLKIFNLYPYNGCRSRKLKRRKKFYE